MVKETVDASIDRVLWTEAEIAARVAEVASELAADIRRLPEPVVVVGVATGAFLFLADLVRRVGKPLAVDLVRVESYGDGTESSGRPQVTADLKVDVAGKHVVVVSPSTLPFLSSSVERPTFVSTPRLKILWTQGILLPVSLLIYKRKEHLPYQFALSLINQQGGQSIFS